MLLAKDVVLEKVNMDLYKTPDGKYFAKEESARNHSATHNNCSCGKPKKKYWLRCDDCITEADRKKNRERQVVEWDGVTPLYCEELDKYIWSDPEEVLEDLDEDDERTLSDFTFLLCYPNRYSQIDPDQWYDILPEDGEVDDELMKKLDELNEFIVKMKPASWGASEKRVII